MAKNEATTTEKKEVAAAEEVKFDLVTIQGSLAEAIEEEMDGLGAIPFDKVKIPSGGGLAFELPGEDEDNPESATSIEGVILDHHPVNAYWKDKYQGGNEQPDCSSFDGKQGTDRETGEIKQCSTCPFNQYGSDTEGKGKACKNIHRTYILREGNPVPLILALPPTSLRFLRDYIAKRVLLKGMRCWEAITKITLKKEKSADGITYSRAAFTFVDKLTPQQIEEAKAMAEVIKTTTRTVPIVDESDYNTSTSSEATPQVDNEEFQDVDGQPLPFN